jgi:hypothetical protein
MPTQSIGLRGQGLVRQGGRRKPVLKLSAEIYAYAALPQGAILMTDRIITSEEFRRAHAVKAINQQLPFCPVDLIEELAIQLRAFRQFRARAAAQDRHLHPPLTRTAARGGISRRQR